MVILFPFFISYFLLYGDIGLFLLVYKALQSCFVILWVKNSIRSCGATLKGLITDLGDILRHHLTNYF